MKLTSGSDNNNNVCQLCNSGSPSLEIRCLRSLDHCLITKESKQVVVYLWPCLCPVLTLHKWFKLRLGKRSKLVDVLLPQSGVLGARVCVSVSLAHSHLGNLSWAYLAKLRKVMLLLLLLGPALRAYSFLGILSCAKLHNTKLLLLPKPKVGLILRY